jgi:hypothetical protein
MIDAAVTGLQQTRKQLKAQEASIPESLDQTMQAVELALSTCRTTVALMRSQIAVIDTVVDHIKDTGRLNEAVVKRVEVLRKI